MMPVIGSRAGQAAAECRPAGRNRSRGGRDAVRHIRRRVRRSTLPVLLPGKSCRVHRALEGGRSRHLPARQRRRTPESERGRRTLASRGRAACGAIRRLARQCVDDAALAQLTGKLHPKLIMLGPSTILRPSSLTRTAQVASRGGRRAGRRRLTPSPSLIAGGTCPNPLDGGADLITGSSYKTLGCPPAGFVVGRERKFEAVLKQAASPKLLSNYDAGRLARFTAALARAHSSFVPYARAIAANTEALRGALLRAESDAARARRRRIWHASDSPHRRLSGGCRAEHRRTAKLRYHHEPVRTCREDATHGQFASGRNSSPAAAWESMRCTASHI